MKSVNAIVKKERDLIRSSKMKRNYRWGWRGEAEKSNHRCKEGKNMKKKKKKKKSGRRRPSPP